MNATHLHLFLNHIPILGSVFGLGLLLVALWRKNEPLKKAAMWFFVIAALLAVPTYLTGEPAEHAAEPLPGVSKPILEQHEQAAKVAFSSVAVLGTLAIAGLILFRRNRIIPNWFGFMMVTASLAISTMMVWTGNLGGQVRHTEIRSNATATSANHEHHD